jgi:hypothetical protein
MGWGIKLFHEKLGEVLCQCTRINILSMNSSGNGNKVDVQIAMAMVMGRICSKRKPPLMSPNPDETHIIIGNFPEKAVVNFGNNQPVLCVTS